VAQLRSDIKDLAGFVTSVSEVRPGPISAAQRERAEAVAAAQERVADAIKEATKPSETGVGTSNRYLKQILDELRGTPGGKLRELPR